MEEFETPPEGASPQHDQPEPEQPVAERPETEQPEPEQPEQEQPEQETPSPDPAPSVSMEELLASGESALEDVSPIPVEDSQLMAVLEAIVYVAEEPLTLAQIAAALAQPVERVRSFLGQLVAEFEKPEHGVTIREVAGGYKMTTKAEHHEAVRSFVKSLKPPLKLSLPALETLAVVAYKQPVTSPEIMEIRGVRGAGVLNTLLDRKLIAAAGRKNVIGKPILYKTTKEFLIQFGLKDLSELPSLKEFEEIRRMAFADSEVAETNPIDTGDSPETTVTPVVEEATSAVEVVTPVLEKTHGVEETTPGGAGDSPPALTTESPAPTAADDPPPLDPLPPNPVEKAEEI